MAIRLRPGVLDDLGLTDALEWYTTEFEKRSGIACIFRQQGVPEVEDTLGTAAYRIAQEALTNVARHSFATHVEVKLEAEAERLLLAIHDNGGGFDLRKLNQAECLGIVGMRERAALVGGTLEIRSAPGEGTQVRVEMPLAGAGEKDP